MQTSSSYLREKQSHPYRWALALALGVLSLALWSFYIFFSAAPSPLPLHTRVTRLPVVQTVTDQGQGAISGEIAVLVTPQP